MIRKTPCVLIADLEVEAVDRCRLQLSQSGCDVTCAASGQMAYRACSDQRFDLVVLSAGLPDISGVELFDQLKRLHAGLAGLLIIEPGDSESIATALHHGFSGVVTRPLIPEVLEFKLKEAIRQADLYEENIRLKTLVPLYQLGEKFLSASSAEQVYHLLLDIIQTEIGATAATVMVYDQSSGDLKIAAARNLSREITETARVRPGERISGRVYANGVPVILNRLDQDSSAFADQLKRRELSAAISFPMISEGRVIGVINLSHTDDLVRFTNADLELLSVISSLANMALGNLKVLREREQAAKLQALLNQYLAPEIALEISQEEVDLMTLGDIRDCTVLFADLRQFTRLIQELELMNLRDFLNELFDRFTKEVYRSGGTLDKFMGDAALVIYGAPVDLEDPCFNAVKAGLTMLDLFDELKSGWAERRQVIAQAQLGIGIARGELFVGNIGSSQRLDYTVLGKEVNLAQRLASEQDGGAVLISEPVEKAISGRIPVRSRGWRSLKGLAEPIRIFQAER